ncbi:MAG: anti-sigma B factor antagonist [Candidatus Aquicultor secundus]|uniref:Anti-sigma factor antagonist n=1 Tax=Candidatus Aquicultor secundus TaxID=1973895 RepID=A0A2M7TBX2_9ACTN|nr:STAS domain-containing protein [Candidatus Aquicultor secundus]NCO65452.1 STAS domain-containing protein [Solirubrobacter sp.]OIO84603.1 MAG: anti-sigma B factor antagonist [Candidatus Aquicultor secundus]PIU26970.1 MAG: anti-sigma B factor antagonist [Candidatus Aquicultor secundus]PIW21284.1 MAG: anti-sigma B factor antagonist [Candidatus Aquicultor secundus]PIX52395.1 MAG: anti-sigma B factor antagonist [Candidatus Aquicultor secundus]
MDLKIESKEVDGIGIIILEGEVDVYTAPKLKSRLIDLVDEGKYNIIIDLQKVEFMDSSGLGVLVGGLKRVKSHQGSISLVCTQENILKIFRITGLVKVFPIFSSEDEAINSLKGS